MKQLLLLSLVFMLPGCTSTPLSDNQISVRNRQIRGKVQLSESASVQSVYIWLEGFNIGAFPSEDGEFTITLPSGSSQEGVSGIFNLYYYVSNYQLTKTELAVRNGEFVFSNGEINAEGQLSIPKFIPRVLSINTVLTPSIACTDSGLFMKVEVVLSSERDSVEICYPGQVSDGQTTYILPLFFEKSNSEEKVIVQGIPVGIIGSDSLVIKRGQPIIRTTLLTMDPNVLSAGEYEVIPYLLIMQPDLPDGLIKSLGQNVLSFGFEYLKLPMIRGRGNLLVTSSSDGN